MRVTVRTKNGATVNRLICDKESFKIGKNVDSLIALNGWKVSDNHAVIEKVENKIYVRDLGSKTGTYVNDVRIKESYGPLLEGEHVSIGDYFIEVSSSSPGVIPQSSFTALEAEKASVAAIDGGDFILEKLSKIDEDEIAVDEEKVALEREWRVRIHKQLIDTIDLRRINISQMDDSVLRDLTRGLIEEVLSKIQNFPSNKIDKNVLAKQVLEEAVGLGPLEDLIEVAPGF